MMNIIEAMSARHAVRDYTDQPIDEDTVHALRIAIEQANTHSGLNIQLIHDDEDAFGGCPTHYGRFRNVRYCIALIGSDHGAPSILDERIGYYGEQLALDAVQLGLDTGWVVLHETTAHHGKWQIHDGERMPAAIAIGHGARAGRPHRSKPIEELGLIETANDVLEPAHVGHAPQWFIQALEAVQLAPSALGKQPYRFTLLADGRSVHAEALDDVQSEIGLGIAKLHFELGAGDTDIVWA
ncbi:nitroreductase family protein [Bifidobacterium hapali]|nr:nitroreductase family protein [Bifidobacterium hapali]